MVKYAAGAYEKRDASVISKHPDDTDSVRVNARPLNNAKIAGAAQVEREHRRRAKGDEPLAEKLCLTEMSWFALGCVTWAQTMTLSPCKPSLSRTVVLITSKDEGPTRNS